MAIKLFIVGDQMREILSLENIIRCKLEMYDIGMFIC